MIRLMQARPALGPALALATLLVACGKDGAGPPTDPTTGFEIRIAPLSLSDVGGVTWGVAVTSSIRPVWSKDDITSEDFGNGRGSIAYVGPCVANENPHTIAITLHQIRSSSGAIIDPRSYRNPAPPGDPIEVLADCFANRDTPVEVNITLLRDASQGFFDVGVTFDDIFCSAKFDCLRDGERLDLLHNPATEKRDTTVVLGFACTAGGLSSGGGQPTWLHLSDLVVRCEDEDGDEVQYLLDPSIGVGQNDGAFPIFFQTAIYQGQERLEPYDKCYWNLAFGLNEGAGTGLKSCHLLAQGTASSASFAPKGTTPSQTIYPFVQWDIPLTDDDGVLACGNHPLGGVGPQSGVSTEYTPWSGSAFTHEWECDEGATVTTNKLECAGMTALGHGTAFYPEPRGLTVAFGATRDPRYYELPQGYAFGPDSYCCVNPCCDTSDDGDR